MCDIQFPLERPRRGYQHTLSPYEFPYGLKKGGPGNPLAQILYTVETDFDGDPRFNGIIDMGCEEVADVSA